MNTQKRSAFTLVELIVVITILAILGTIAYISFTGYSKDAHNSSRISDIKTIEKAMSIFATSDAVLPTPDNSVDITSSGTLLWSQGTFGTESLAELRTISEAPTDSKYGVEYSYSLAANRKDYQIAAAIEGSVASSLPLAPTTYALTGENRISYTAGSYIDYDVSVNSGAGCSLIAIPSLILSDIPAGGVIESGTSYTYSFRGSEHLPNTYTNSSDASLPGSGFQTLEVLDSCNIDTLAELELYIAQLSTAFQALAGYEQYERIIFYSNRNDFKLITAKNLQDRGFNISSTLLAELGSSAPHEVMVDTFSDTDGTLIESHIPDSGSGSWNIIAGGVSSAYDISPTNTLEKNDGSSTLIYPSPDPSITSADYEVSFDIEDFSGGEITAYLRYTDSDNYYKLSVSPTAYTVMRRESGGDSVFEYNTDESISAGSNIRFSVVGDTLSFDINGINKGTNVGGDIDSIGKPVIGLQNSGASIDNYTLTYK